MDLLLIALTLTTALVTAAGRQSLKRLPQTFLKTNVGIFQSFQYVISYLSDTVCDLSCSPVRMVIQLLRARCVAYETALCLQPNP